MERLILFVIACSTQIGCQAPGQQRYDVYPRTQSRVPPPPTGVVGPGTNFYNTPAPMPPVEAGAALWPSNDYGSPGRYWESADARLAGTRSVAQDSNRGYDNRTAQLRAAAPPREENLSNLTRNDQIAWRDPDTKAITGPLSHYDNRGTIQDPPVSRVGSGLAQREPQLLPRARRTQPLISNQMYSAPPNAPPRVRGFANTGSRAVTVPAELQDDRVRQASAAAAANPQPRYDDLRR